MSKKTNRTDEEIAVPKPHRQAAKMPPMPKKVAQSSKKEETVSSDKNGSSNPPPIRKKKNSREAIQVTPKPTLPPIMSSEMVTGDNPIITEEDIQVRNKNAISLSSKASAILSKVSSPPAVENHFSSPSLMPTTRPPLDTQQPLYQPHKQQYLSQPQPPSHNSPPPTQLLESFIASPSHHAQANIQLQNTQTIPDNNRLAFLAIENSRTAFYRGANVTKIPIKSDPIIIGRRDVLAGQYPDVDLGDYWNFDRSISRKHLRVFRDASSGSFFAEDLCSHNATFFNSPDHPMGRERVELHNGDKIYISSSIVFVFTII